MPWWCGATAPAGKPRSHLHRGLLATAPAPRRNKGKLLSMRGMLEGRFWRGCRNACPSRRGPHLLAACPPRRPLPVRLPPTTSSNSPRWTRPRSKAGTWACCTPAAVAIRIVPQGCSTVAALPLTRRLRGLVELVSSSVSRRSLHLRNLWLKEVEGGGALGILLLAFSELLRDLAETRCPLRTRLGCHFLRRCLLPEGLRNPQSHKALTDPSDSGSALQLLSFLVIVLSAAPINDGARIAEDDRGKGRAGGHHLLTFAYQAGMSSRFAGMPGAPAETPGAP